MNNLERKIIISEDEKIDDIIERSLSYTPIERLRVIGRMARFLYNNMSPNGKRFFEQERFKQNGKEDYK